MVLSSVDQNDYDDQSYAQATQRLIPNIQPWWYHPVTLVAWGVAILFVLTLFVWGTFVGYITYTNWYDKQIQRAYVTGHTVGVVDGTRQGMAVQKRQDTKSFTQTLAKVKANDVKNVQKVKLASYAAGKNDATKAMQVWWANTCSYDTMIHKYICSSSP